MEIWGSIRSWGNTIREVIEISFKEDNILQAISLTGADFIIPGNKTKVKMILLRSGDDRYWRSVGES